MTLVRPLILRPSYGKYKDLSLNLAGSFFLGYLWAGCAARSHRRALDVARLKNPTSRLSPACKRPAGIGLTAPNIRQHAWQKCALIYLCVAPRGQTSSWGRDRDLTPRTVRPLSVPVERYLHRRRCTGLEYLGPPVLLPQKSDARQMALIGHPEFFVRCSGVLFLDTVLRYNDLTRYIDQSADESKSAREKKPARAVKITRMPKNFRPSPFLACLFLHYPSLKDLQAALHNTAPPSNI